MVNEINGLNPAVTGGTGKKSSRVDTASSSQASSESAQTAATDNFELSARAQLLAKLEAQINNLPDIDQERIDALRDAIQNGRYDIDSTTLAQDIINFEFK